MDTGISAQGMHAKNVHHRRRASSKDLIWFFFNLSFICFSNPCYKCVTGLTDFKSCRVLLSETSSFTDFFYKKVNLIMEIAMVKCQCAMSMGCFVKVRVVNEKNEVEMQLQTEDPICASSDKSSFCIWTKIPTQPILTYNFAYMPAYLHIFAYILMYRHIQA